MPSSSCEHCILCIKGRCRQGLLSAVAQPAGVGPDLETWLSAAACSRLLNDFGCMKCVLVLRTGFFTICSRHRNFYMSRAPMSFSGFVTFQLKNLATQPLGDGGEGMWGGAILGSL